MLNKLLLILALISCAPEPGPDPDCMRAVELAETEPGVWSGSSVLVEPDAHVCASAPGVEFALGVLHGGAIVIVQAGTDEVCVTVQAQTAAEYEIGIVYLSRGNGVTPLVTVDWCDT